MPVAKLDNAPRCRHTKLNGQPCAAPARRGRKYCVFHESAHAKRPDYAVRLVEDAMSLQLALFQVMRALDDHALDPKRAALKLYALQIAASNLKRLHQETEHMADAADPAREKSLMEIFLDTLQVPAEEREELLSDFDAEFGASPASTTVGPSTTAGTAPPQASPRFDINACAQGRREGVGWPTRQLCASRARGRARSRLAP